MQYKQISRILAEIVGPGTPVRIVLATSKFLVKNEVLPKLGPYKKRSAGQLLWRLASDSTRSPEERWDAVEKLLRPTVAKHRKVSGAGRPAESEHSLTSMLHRDQNKSDDLQDIDDVAGTQSTAFSPPLGGSMRRGD